MDNQQRSYSPKVVDKFPMYVIHADGKVWSKHTSRFLKPFLSSQGHGDDYYLSVKLCDNGKEKTVTVHRLVALAFIPNPGNLATVNHKDGNKQNNNVENLEWMTQGENKAHAFDTGVSEAWWVGDIHSRATFTNEEIHGICKLFSEGIKPLNLAPSTTKLYQKLFRIYARDNWKTISCNYKW